MHTVTVCYLYFEQLFNLVVMGLYCQSPTNISVNLCGYEAIKREDPYLKCVASLQRRYFTEIMEGKGEKSVKRENHF